MLLGCLAGSVEHMTRSRREFETHTGHRDYLKEKKNVMRLQNNMRKRFMWLRKDLHDTLFTLLYVKLKMHNGISW